MLGFKPLPTEVVKAVDPQVRSSNFKVFRGTYDVAATDLVFIYVTLTQKL